MDFTILHFAIHIVWRANVICTYRKSGIARKMTVAYPELRLIRCDELGCPDDGMLVVGGLCLLSIGAMVVVGIPMCKSDNRKVHDSALW